MLATLLIVTGGLLGQTAPGSLQIATEGLLQSVAIVIPPGGDPSSPFIGAASAWAFNRPKKKADEEEEEFLIALLALVAAPPPPR